MPTKLKVVVSLIILIIIYDGVSTNWVGLVTQSLLLYGIMRGHEAIKWALVALASWAVAVSAFYLILGIAALFADRSSVSILIYLSAGAAGVAVNGYFIWCMRQKDVIDWMFKRSLKGIIEDNEKL